MNIEQEFADLKAVVKAAGEHARKYFYSDVNPATQKSDGSLVTEIDKRVEAMLREHIAERFPDDTIVGEEDDTVYGESGFVWFIDPIDGTENFVRKIPFFAVTATRLGPSPEDSMAVVYNPISGQLFASLMEDGAYESENLCNLTADPISSDYLLELSIPSYEPWMKPAKHNLLRGLNLEFGKAASRSCALLGYAYVAASRVDGMVQTGLAGWDSAAGLYLVKAAGGAISVQDEAGVWQRYDGAIKDLYGPEFDGRPTLCVSHPDIHEKITEFVGDLKRWADA